jgi:hypothetical protein
MSTTTTETSPESKMPEEFPKIIKDFVDDINNTFPEYYLIINKWWKPSEFINILNEEERSAAVIADMDTKVVAVFKHCLRVFPERFFDILYQNNEIFSDNSEINTEFLPGISFKYLWQCDISDKTRETIWKYLQLVLIAIIGCVKNRDAFGDTDKLFKSINEDDFKGKLEETMAQMQKIFEAGSSSSSSSGEDAAGTTAGSAPSFNMGNMPSADDIQGHISGMLDGKLGNLAREIAEETAENLNINMDDATNVNDVFQNLFKNPGKLMGLVKNVGDKLDSRIKSGEIKESELLAEASEIMNKMKNMPGMDNIQAMLGKMGMNIPNMGKNAKVDINAMEAQLNRNMKVVQTKERLKKKMEMKHMANAAIAAMSQQQQPANPQALTDEQLISVFSTGEKVERSPRNGAAVNTSGIASGSSDKKKKKGKK